MSTEQKPTATEPPPPPTPAPAPKAEPNALASALTNWWDKFKAGQLLSYRAMAFTLIAVAAFGTVAYISYGNKKADSSRWTEWDGLASTASMKEYAEKNPGTVPGRLAALDAARSQLGPEGIDRFMVPDLGARKSAVENVEKAREAFTKLADEFKTDPVIRVECLVGVAKAEAALVGMTRDNSTEFRGDPKKAIEYLDKVAAAAANTDWGKDAKKLADELRNLNTQDQVIKLQTSAYGIAPALGPGLDPRMPRDPAHGFPSLPGLVP
ncbi:MAG: hypothetical protein ACKODX_20125 [Gemmata sp.]